MRYLALLAITTMLCMAGCTVQPAPQPKPGGQQQSQNQPVEIDAGLAGMAEEAARKVDGVRESVAVVVDDDISVAVKVGGLDRLRLKTIRREVDKTIDQMAPGYTTHVTTDKKLFRELRKTKEQIRQGRDPAKIRERVTKINASMRG